MSGAIDAEGGRGKKTVFISLAVGTGGGYVTGTTEVAGSEVGCCFAPALLHLFPEIGYYFSRQMSLSAAFRMGFAVGANVMGHATAAPAGLLRLRYALAESGDGLRCRARSAAASSATRSRSRRRRPAWTPTPPRRARSWSAAGLATRKPISGAMKFVGELNALAAVPAGIKELGGCPGRRLRQAALRPPVRRQPRRHVRRSEPAAGQEPRTARGASGWSAR